MAVATLRDQLRRRRFSRQLAEQTERERNGEPIHPAIAARMTKPKLRDPLFQVFVDLKGNRRSLAVSPKAGKEFCEIVMQNLNAQICLGKIKAFGNARIEPVF